MRPIPQSSLKDVLNSFSLDLFANFNCHRIGSIVSFNKDEQTARVQLTDKGVKATYDGVQYLTMPLLVDCPVYIPFQNGKGVTIPISAGDKCLVLFNDRDIDNWFSGNESTAPASSRMHHLGDGLVLVGFHNNANFIEDFNEEAVEIRFDESKIGVGEKIVIKNAAQDLKTLIDSLIDAIKALQVVDPISGSLPVTPATTAALDVLKTQFGGLLSDN